MSIALKSLEVRFEWKDDGNLQIKRGYGFTAEGHIVDFRDLNEDTLNVVMDAMSRWVEAHTS